jgi:hypothetical protein
MVLNFPQNKISQLEEQPGEVIQKSTIAKINIE